MKFKVGDKVRVKSFSELKKLFDKNAINYDNGDWFYTYKLSDNTEASLYFISEMRAACEEVAKVISINKERYLLKFENNVLPEDYLFVEDWLEPFDNPIYVSSFNDEEENKSERLKAILDQIEQLAAEAHKIVEG